MASPPLRRPLDPTITEALIAAVVERFYAKVRRDPRLGPIFAEAIGENWEPHLEKMCDFWSSVMRLSGRYKGKPVQAHIDLLRFAPQGSALHDLAPRDFALWLGLFHETVHELCAPRVAALFMARAEKIAASLKLGMFSRPAPNAGDIPNPRPGQHSFGGPGASHP